MVELLVVLVAYGFGFVSGWVALPFWKRRQLEQAAEQAMQASREKRSASAKAAAVRRANAMADGVGGLGDLNGSGQQHSQDQS